MAETSSRFGLDLPSATEAQSVEYVKNVLDPQIDELTAQLSLLQGARRAIASIFGIDRRGDEAGVFGLAADSSRRGEYEGEGQPLDGNGRLVPRGKPNLRSA